MAYEALYTRGRPKTLSHLVGQEHISAALTRAVMTGRLSHAYLLVGTRGTGKTSTARLLAKAMNCDTVHAAVTEGKTLTAKDIPCNKCAACRSIDSSPDNVEFDAASNRSVEDVTRLLSTAHLAPLQSRVKTFIIDEVHMLSFEAVNSILKLIEEPPPNVAFFLATTEFQKVPQTIRSRCQVLNFRLIPQDKIFPYLQKFANRLEVELEDDAAKKIARLAEGSMRDALTYLDQCYSMSDKKISLDDVNKTLGLISDADLDEIIFAVRNKNRAEVVQAITHAFQSGLTAISIAESLITRLRDFEFQNLSRSNSELSAIENFVSEIRKATLEMQSSGIPDIILEMALMNLAAPKIIAKEIATIENKPVEKKVAGTIANGQNIFKVVIEKLRSEEGFESIINKITANNLNGDILTIKFSSQLFLQTFTDRYLGEFERLAEEIFNIKIKVVAELDSDYEKKNLQFAMKVFQATDYNKIDEE